MNTREVIEQITARPASDGDGVKLLRVFGGAQPERFDPFLLMDEFGSESADDYIGGFPPHPHRGFETITYMLQGKMEHRDHMENVGLLKDGDVQWMTAGKGVIHSEMPKQTEGKMRGFQVWLNLASDKKLTPASYKDVSDGDIPRYNFGGVAVKAIAGKTNISGESISGFFEVADTDPLYLDIHMQPSSKLELALEQTHNTLIYVYEGEVRIGDQTIIAKSQQLSRLSEGGQVKLENQGDTEVRLILLAGIPIKEPIVQYGPFVMNSANEIEQAILDYRNGTLTVS